MADIDRLAGALADAMLAGSWDFDAIRDRCRRVIDQLPDWLTELVRDVLVAYPRPPLDRPRELAAFIRASHPLIGADTWPSRLPRAVRRLTVPTATVRRPFSTPTLDNVAALAAHLGLDVDELDLFADTRLRARRAHSPRIPHYRYRWLARPSGARLLEAPRPRMAALQRRVLDDTLSLIPVHPAAHGFVRGRSAITGAAVHSGAAVVVSFDLEHFFAAITAGRIWGVLRAAGFPEPVAHLLTGLTTHATPVSTLSAMPAGADPSRDFRLRGRLAAPHLPQGAPTSPQLANLVAFALDRRLAAYAAAAGFTYTRYADDLSFSAPGASSTLIGSLQSGVEKVVTSSGFRLNPGKTRTRRSGERQVVTGIVVNVHPNLPRPEFDRLKAVLHDCVTRGPAAANRAGHPRFRDHLLGRISWLAALNPARGARLRAVFDRVVWEQSLQPPPVDASTAD